MSYLNKLRKVIFRSYIFTIFYTFFLFIYFFIKSFNRREVNIICFYSLGDLSILLFFAKQIHKIHNKKIIFYIPRNKLNLISLFNYDYIEFKFFNSFISRYYQYVRFIPEYMKRFGFYFDFNSYQGYQIVKQTNLFEYKKILLGIDNIDDFAIPFLENRKSLEIGKNTKLDLSKCVLLFPTAQTLSISDSIYCDIIKIAKSHKYTVLTNGYLECSNCIDISSSSLDTLFYYAQNCKLVLGVRSGLFDLMNFTKTKKVILYPLEYEVKTEYYSISLDPIKSFSLYKLSNNDNNYEFIVSNVNDIFATINRLMDE